MEQVIRKTYTVFDALKTALQKKLSFAIYRLPGEEEITLVLQKDHQLQKLEDLERIFTLGGFLIAPFTNDNDERTYLIRPDYVIKNILTEDTFREIKLLEPTSINGVEHIAPDEVPKREYIGQLNETILRIKNGEYDKVVLSRVKLYPGSYFSELKKIFHILCAAYPNAFVYLFRIKGQCWVGATPEPLIGCVENEVHIVSLASTRPYSEENCRIENWNHKERVEQEYVTQYIESILDDYGIQEYTKTGPYTKRAGKLLHLRTDFHFPSEKVGDKLPSLISALHPTSAVCGMPMQGSLEYIKRSEKHKREYY